MHGYTRIDTEIFASNGEYVKFLDDFAFIYINMNGVTQEEVIRSIVDDSVRYKEFLKCAKDNFSCFPSEYSIKTAIFFILFEQVHLLINDSIRRSVDMILVPAQKIDLIYPNNTIPETNITYLQGLMRSVQEGFLANSDGELIYFIGKEYGLYKVYSHNSGIHYVNRYGQITNKMFQNRDGRIKTFQEIKVVENDLQEIQKYISKGNKTERCKVLIKRYESSTRKQFFGEKIDCYHLKSWLLRELQQHNAILEIHKQNDIRKPSLQIVDGEVVSEGDGLKTDPDIVQARRSQFHVVK